MESAVIDPRGFEFLIKFSGLEVTYPQVLLTPVTGEFEPVNGALSRNLFFQSQHAQQGSRDKDRDGRK